MSGAHALFGNGLVALMEELNLALANPSRAVDRP